MVHIGTYNGALVVCTLVHIGTYNAPLYTPLYVPMHHYNYNAPLSITNAPCNVPLLNSHSLGPDYYKNNYDSVFSYCNPISYTAAGIHTILYYVESQSAITATHSTQVHEIIMYDTLLSHAHTETLSC